MYMLDYVYEWGKMRTFFYDWREYKQFLREMRDNESSFQIVNQEIWTVRYCFEYAKNNEYSDNDEYEVLADCIFQALSDGKRVPKEWKSDDLKNWFNNLLNFV